MKLIEDKDGGMFLRRRRLCALSGENLSRWLKNEPLRALRGSCLALPLVFGEMPFAEADEVGSYFNQLVVGNVVDRLFQREFARRSEENVLVAASGADVRELFGFRGVDDEVVFPGVLSDDHPFVDFIARLYKKGSSILQVEESISICLTRTVGNHGAVRSSRDFALPGGKTFENGSQDSKPRRAS